MTLHEAHEELAIAIDATDDEVRRAYLRVVRARSPERDPDGFRRAREAFEAISIARAASRTDTGGAAAVEQAPPDASTGAAATPPTEAATDEVDPDRVAALAEIGDMERAFDARDLAAAATATLAHLRAARSRPGGPVQLGAALQLALALFGEGHAATAREIVGSARELLAAIGPGGLPPPLAPLWTLLSDLEAAAKTIAPDIVAHLTHVVVDEDPVERARGAPRAGATPNRRRYRETVVALSTSVPALAHVLRDAYLAPRPGEEHAPPPAEPLPPPRRPAARPAPNGDAPATKGGGAKSAFAGPAVFAALAAMNLARLLNEPSADVHPTPKPVPTVQADTRTSDDAPAPTARADTRADEDLPASIEPMSNDAGARDATTDATPGSTR